MKIAVMGTGAMGGHIGARLAKAGATVTFLARGAHLAAMRATGLHVSSPLGDVHLTQVVATDDPSTVGPVDVVLLGTKMYDLDTVAVAIAPMLREDTAVVCLQNGVDAPVIVERLYGRQRVVGSTVLINAELTGPGAIKHNALNSIRVGEMDGRETSARLERLVGLLNVGGIETAISADIRLDLWRKLLLLAPMGAISALTRLPLAEIRAHPGTLELAVQGMREVVAVANAEGVRLTDADVDRTRAFVMGMSPTWKSSLTFDLEHGRRLEIEWLSGAVVRFGEAAKIDTPFHRVALGVLKPHAAGRA